ncbi:MAG: glycosyltransferase family 4 protein [Chthoniobacterales bacterium]
MKITIVLGAFFPVPPTMGGAVEKVWFALAAEFARRGHNVTSISRAMPQLPDRETIAGVQHWRVRGFDTPGSIIWLKVLDLLYSLRVKRRLPPADIIVTNTFWLPILLRTSSRGQVYVHIGRFPKGQIRFYGSAARLQAPSRAVAQAVKDELPRFEAKVTVIPYPRIESNECDARHAPSVRDKTILFVGRVHPEKGVHLLMKAFVEAPPSLFSGWKLQIVGPTAHKYGGGGAKYLRQLSKAAEAADAATVELCGAIFDPAALAERYRAAQIFVYPSLAQKGESFGLAPLEAMAHACTVLVSDLACFHDFVIDGQTGMIFNQLEADPVKALRTKMADLVGDDSARSRIGEAGYRKSLEYSLPKVADQFLADFERLLSPADG